MSCTRFSECSAPLCPESDGGDIWFPDEQICAKYRHPWIKAQKKIVERTKDVTKFYSLEMLKQNCQIRSGITGIDPDGDIQEQLKRWLRKHPPKRKLTETQRRELAERLNSGKVRKSA